ncbi:hypothetical protein ACHAXS_007962 [Conticribra weissflogii]
MLHIVLTRKDRESTHIIIFIVKKATKRARRGESKEVDLYPCETTIITIHHQIE